MEASPEAQHERLSRAAPVVGLALFVAATVSAGYFLSGDPCRSSGRIEFFYLTPVLVGLATFAVLPIHRWLLRVLAGAAIAGVVAAAILAAGMYQWVMNCTS